MQDSVGLLRMALQHLDRLLRGEHDEFDLAPPRLRLDLLHHGEGALRTGADHQAPAVSGDLLFDGQRRVAIGVTELLRGLLSPFAHLGAIDHDVVLVEYAVDGDRSKGEGAKIHRRGLASRWPPCESAKSKVKEYSLAWSIIDGK